MSTETSTKKDLLTIDINDFGYNIRAYETTPDHAKKYGLTCKKPLFIQSVFLIEEKRNQGNGKQVLSMIEEYAIKNNVDLIFGHIDNDAIITVGERQGVLSDREIIRNWLHSIGYAVNQDNFDYHKPLLNKKNLKYFGGIGFKNCVANQTYEVKTEFETKRFSNITDAKSFYDSIDGEKSVWNITIDELVDAWYKR